MCERLWGGVSMKRIAAMMILFIMLVAFGGCSAKENLEQQNAQVQAILNEVLNVERPFITEDSEEVMMDSYYFTPLYEGSRLFIPLYSAFVDLDQDGLDEMVLLEGLTYDFLILHYDGQSVYGYYRDNNNTFEIKTDGTFSREITSTESAISTVTFENNEFAVKDIAYMNEEENIYRLNGKNADKEKVEAYFDDWRERTTDLMWTDTI